MNSRPFRVLLIDDNATDTAAMSADAQSENTGRNSLSQIIRRVVGMGSPSNLQLFVSTSVRCGTSGATPDIRGVCPVELKVDELRTGSQLEGFLGTIDVLILDLGETGVLRNAGGVTRELLQNNLQLLGVNNANLTDEHIELAADGGRGGFSGIGFYHLYLDLLRSCQAVFILTQYDHDASPEVVKRLIDPFCVDHVEEQSSTNGKAERNADTGLPWTTKFHKTGGADIIRLCDILEDLYHDFNDGYTNLTNRGAIEFAATNDLPVLIVGESGTGKEYIAKAIHRAWLRERRRRPDHKSRHLPLVTVNCAGLTPELARSELFGHVAGSFTGATDHRLGKILLACGCRGFKATKERDPQLPEILAQVRKAAEALNYEQSGDLQKDYATLATVLSALSDILNPPGVSFEHRWRDSLLGVLHRVHKKLAAAVDGNDLVSDFCESVLKKNDVLDELSVEDGEASDLDVCYKLKYAVGTLFLDEFGDLPSEVQNLLLRFLEDKSGEIQPVGYTGRIVGLKVRLITATSDPRVAQFAGVQLLGSWRSHEENERPLRMDLLQRVKHIVIRAEPVTAKNVEDVLRAILGPSGAPLDAQENTNAEIHWEKSAIEKVVSLTKEQIAKVKKAEESFRSTGHVDALPWFGHRRELQRIVELANAYVRTAQERGLRAMEFKRTANGRPVVSAVIIEKLWSPAEVQATSALHRLPGEQAAQIPSKTSPPSEYQKQCRADFEDTVKAHLPQLKLPWSAQTLKDALQALGKVKKKHSKADNAIKALFERNPGSGKKSEAHYRDYLLVVGFSDFEITSDGVSVLKKRVKDWRKDWWTKGQ